MSLRHEVEERVEDGGNWEASVADGGVPQAYDMLCSRGWFGACVSVRATYHSAPVDGWCGALSANHSRPLPTTRLVSEHHNMSKPTHKARRGETDGGRTRRVAFAS